MRGLQALSGFIGCKEKRRRSSVSFVKDPGSTGGKHWKLLELRQRGGSGILGGAVKCVDIERNTSGESDFLALF
jgi:hypothetical protein